jgi:hypothetical protein
MSAAVAKRSKEISSQAKEVWGQMSPEMRALPNDKWRMFCLALVTGPGGHGKYTDALRAAGIAEDSTKKNQAWRAHELAHDDRMIAAVRAESLRLVRAGHPEAVNALFEIVRDPTHKDRVRAAMAFLDRGDPIIAKQDISITHLVIDPDQEALEELRALRQVGASREQIIQIFGGNYLPKLERLEAQDKAKRADEAKIIDAEVIDV